MKNKFFETGKKLIGHELISGSFYLFVGGTIANFLAFLYNVFLARTLAPVDYGVYVSLLSIITLLGVPVQSLNPIVVRFATEYFVKGEKEKEAKLYFKMTQSIILVSLLIFLGFIAFSGQISDFLHINNIWYVIMVGGIVSFLYLSFVNNAFIQGFLKFNFFAFINVTGSLIKLLAGIVLVLLGMRVFGALGGIFLMTFGAFIIGFFPIRQVFARVRNNKEKIPLKEITLYALPTIVIIFSLISFTSTDVILIKHFFNPQDAAAYGGLSLLGKVIFYFTSMIPAVMFPLIIKRYNSGKKFNSLFYLGLLLVLIPSVFITGFYFVFPKFVIDLFFSGKATYMAIAGYAGFFGIFLTLFSLINVCVNFFLSLNKTKIAPLVVGASALQIILICIFHSNFYQVIADSIVASLILLAALIVYYLFLFANPQKIKDFIPLIGLAEINVNQ
ncbi:MAG: oligosaccharide flippase family protein [Candidatus Levyibacteriota bacterium]